MTNVWNLSPSIENLPERMRLAINATAPAFLAMTINAVLMLGGGGADIPVFEAGPPTWASAAIWIVILIMLGAARFEVARGDEAETFAIDALLAASIVYPFSARAFDGHWMAANTLTALAIAAMALVAVFPQSRRAAGLVSPSIAWLAWLSWLAIAETAAA